MTRGDSQAALIPRRELSIETAFLVCVSSLLVISAVIGSLPERPARAAITEDATPAPASAEGASVKGGYACADGLQALRDDLRRLHRGEALDRSALRSQATALREACGRRDVQRVTQHLTSLDSLQAMLAGAGIDQIEAALDAYSEDPSFDRADLMRALNELMVELDELQDPLPAAYARRIQAELLLRSEGAVDAELAATFAGSAALTYGRVGFFEQEIEALEVSARALLACSELGAARAQAWRGLRLSRQIDDSLYESLFLRCLVRAADRAGLGLERERLLREWGAIARAPQRTELEEWWAWVQETVTWLVDEDHPQRALSFYKEALSDRRSAAGADPLSSERLRDQARDLEATVLIRAGELERARALLEIGITYTDRSRLLRAYLGLQTLEVVEGRERERIFQELSTLLNPAWISSLSPELMGIAEIYSGEHHHRAGRPELARADQERAVQRAVALDQALAPRSTIGETASLGGEALGLHAVQLLARAYLQLDRPMLAALTVEALQARSLRGSSRDLEEADILAWAESAQLGLLTWALGPDEGVAIWIGPEGQTDSLLIPHGRRTVQRAVNHLTQALRDESAAAAESIGLELTESLFPSALLERLESSADESLLLLTHGPLASLPVGALRIQRAEASSPLFLSQAATLKTLPGIPDPRPGASSLQDAHWILAGAPDGLDGRPRLKEAVDELSKINARRPSELIAGAEMTRAAMFSALEGDACLHVATHVMWIETETGPGPAWELASGDALGVADLPVELGARELVVLMGCESAGGQVLDGEGVLGFTSAFLASGTRSVVATQWPVRDEAARDFGVALHEALLAGGSPSAAVQSACRRLRESGSPDWAAFQLFGRD